MNDKEIALEKLKLNVEVWKKIVDVQQHFNDLEMKVRNFGILIISAFISAIGVSLKSNYEVSLFDVSTPVGGLIALVALFVWNLVFFVDVYWYHPLLKGAVLKGAAIEKELECEIPEIGLTKAIGDASSIKFWWWKELRSTTKAKIFYNGVSISLILMALSLIFFTGNKKTTPEPPIVEPQLTEINKNLNALIEQSKVLNNSISKLSISKINECPQITCPNESLQGELEILKKDIDEHLDRHLILIKKIVNK